MFLILLLLVLLLVLLLRSLLFGLKLKRAFNQTFGFQQSSSTSDRRRSFWSSAPSRKAKKIDPGVGEDAEFTEVIGSEHSTVSNHAANHPHDSSDSTSAHPRYRTEAQVVDVEWQELAD